MTNMEVTHCSFSQAEGKYLEFPGTCKDKDHYVRRSPPIYHKVEQCKDVHGGSYETADML